MFMKSDVSISKSMSELLEVDIGMPPIPLLDLCS